MTQRPPESAEEREHLAWLQWINGIPVRTGAHALPESDGDVTRCRACQRLWTPRLADAPCIAPGADQRVATALTRLPDWITP